MLPAAQNYYQALKKMGGCDYLTLLCSIVLLAELAVFGCLRYGDPLGVSASS